MDNHFTIETADHHRKLFLELHKLQQHRVACDVAIAAEDGEISAHRIILMSASKYFRKRIMSVMHESNPRIYLQGVTIAELANIIKYIYSGKLFITKDSLDMTLEVCEMLELDEVIKGYKDSLLKNINTEKTVEKIEITGDKSVKEHRHLSSQAPAQTLGSDRIDKVVKESAGKRKVLEHVIDLSNEDDEIIIKIEDEDEYSTESSSAHRQKHGVSSDFYTAGGDHINTSSKAVTSISDTLVLERHSSSEKPAVKNKIMAKKLSQASLPTNLENTNSSKAEPQSKRTSSTTSPSVPSYKVPCLGSSRNEKQKLAEITSENHDHRDAAVYGGSLLLPDNLTEDLRASQVFSQTGERPFLIRREVTQTTSIQTPSEMKPSISPQNNLYVGNTEHIANANNQAQLPVYVFSGPVPKVNNPALKPLFAYTQVPVSSSVAIMTPRVSSKPGQSAEQPKQKSLNSSGKSAVPINVFRNISNIKGAILTAPMTESSVKKQSSTDHHMTSRIIGVNKSTMPTKLTLSDNEIGDISPSQTFVIPVQLKERAQVGIAKLGQNSGHENINLVKKEPSQTETTIYSPVTSNPCDKQLYCSREKEDNHIKACQRIDQITINTKGGHYHLEENLADTVDNCSGTVTSSRTVTPNSLNSVESMGEYKPADELAETHLQSHSPTDDLKPCNLVLDEVKTVPLSDNEYLNKTDRTGNVSRPSVNSRLVIKLSRISDQEVMRWTKRKSTDTHSTTKSTPADELTTRIDGSSEPPVKIRRSADLPEGVSRSSARFTCDICHAVVGSVFEYNAHMKLIHGRYAYQCPVSGCSFSTILKRHLVSHEHVYHTSQQHQAIRHSSLATQIAVVKQEPVQGIVMSGRKAGRPTLQEAAMALSNDFRKPTSSINIGHRMKYKDFIALTKPSSTDKSHTGEARRRGNDDNQEIIASQEGSEPHENLTKPVPVTVNNIRHAMKPKVDTVDDSIKTVEHFSDLSKTIDIVDDSRKPDDNVNALTKMVDEVIDSTKLFENADDLTLVVDNVIELTKMTENVENSRITDGCFNVSHKTADTVMEADITNAGNKYAKVEGVTNMYDAETAVVIHDLHMPVSPPDKNIVGRRRGRPSKAMFDNNLVCTFREDQQSHARMRNIVPGDYVIPDMGVLLKSNHVTFDR